MNLLKIKMQKLNIIKLIVFLSFTFLLCGYGYNGDLPNLGKNTKPAEIKQENTNILMPAQDTDKPAFPSTKIVFPKIYSNYSISKYSDYLQDMKQIEPILANLKDVIISNRPDKIQQFSAKVNVLNLYVENLKLKYNNKPEKNYETFKQIVILNSNLSEASGYLRETNKHKNTTRGSLANKLQDESYLRQKIDTSIISINKVLEILKDTK